MTRVEIYSKDWCWHCAMAKEMLEAKGVTYTDIDVTSDRQKELEMVERSGARTVPQIFIDDRHVGGHDDLVALDSSGALDPLLKRNNVSANQRAPRAA